MLSSGTRPAVLRARSDRSGVRVSCADSALYTCGNPKFGRLGFGIFDSPFIENPLDSPRPTTQPCELQSAVRGNMIRVAVDGAPADGTPRPGARVRHVAAGNDHTMIVLEDGRVFACGRGQAGQLGLGDRKDVNSLTRHAPGFEPPDTAEAEDEEAATVDVSAGDAREVAGEAAAAEGMRPSSTSAAAAMVAEPAKLVGGVVLNRFNVRSAPAWSGAV